MHDTNVKKKSFLLKRNKHTQSHTNSGHQAPWMTIFCTVGLHIHGSSELTLLHVTHLAPQIFGRVLDFWKICAMVCIHTCTHTLHLLQAQHPE